jgi:GNAT superfamily N-acetyltransferase
MKLCQINEAISKMARTEMGMGLDYYQNDEIALVGGMRSGNSSAGQTRIKYMIYDIVGLDGQMTAEEQQKRERGFIEVFVKDGSADIIGLVNIELKPKFRRSGIGKKVIKSLMKTVKGDLKIFDIQAKALSFWTKMGIEFYGDSRFENRLDVPRKVLTKKAKFGLYGIIER